MTMLLLGLLKILFQFNMHEWIKLITKQIAEIAGAETNKKMPNLNKNK